MRERRRTRRSSRGPKLYVEINGITLTEAQSATLRVAITGWQSRLAEGEARELGKIGPLYQARCEEILSLIFGGKSR
jgi:hypothetical protein